MPVPADGPRRSKRREPRIVLRWTRGLVAAVSMLVIAVPPAGASTEVPAVAIPAIAAVADDPAGLVPAGWTIEKRIDADLDGDGERDVVLVLHAGDRRNVVKLGNVDVDTNPRLLVVAFAKPARPRFSTVFSTVLQNHVLIPRTDRPNVDDAFDDVAVRDRVLTVRLHEWFSAGSWDTTNVRLAFRYEDRCFRLIGYDATTTNRASLAATTTSINYLTRRVVETDDPGEPPAKTRPRRRPPSTLRPGPPVCLDDVGDGLRFAPGIDRR